MKARDKKRLIIVGIFALLLAVLCVGYYALTKYSKEKESDSGNDMGEVLSTVDENEVAALELQNENGDFRFVKGTDGLWRYAEDTELSLDQDAMDTIVSVMVKITSVRRAADNPDDLKQFGLYEPQKICQLTLKDGSHVDLYLGDAVPGIGGYYGMHGGDGNVYVFDESAYACMAYSLDDVKTIEPDVDAEEAEQTEQAENAEDAEQTEEAE